MNLINRGVLGLALALGADTNRRLHNVALVGRPTLELPA
jgi:hypothetical protein